MPRKFSFTKKKQSGYKTKQFYYYKQELEKQQNSLPSNWALSYNTSRNQLKLSKITDNDEISHCLTIHDNLSFCVSLFGRPVVLDVQKTITDTEFIFSLINIIENTQICPGNGDDKLIKLAEDKRGKFLDIHGMHTFSFVQ